MSVRILQKPSIAFTCASCHAKCEADPEDFRELNTMPPTWQVRCCFCRNITTCSPTAMISRLVGSMYP